MCAQIVANTIFKQHQSIKFSIACKDSLDRHDRRTMKSYTKAAPFILRARQGILCRRKCRGSGPCQTLIGIARERCATLLTSTIIQRLGLGRRHPAHMDVPGFPAAISGDTPPLTPLSIRSLIPKHRFQTTDCTART
ncbi:hypothetical protein N7G274_006286 [Stereocaulon virgatum]|uniref:Uncharacterized protein n=1 Tax=Stereocaulon virgatum TaxID=373712 RepID=A0ABR4A582_9LECA